MCVIYPLPLFHEKKSTKKWSGGIFRKKTSRQNGVKCYYIISQFDKLVSVFYYVNSAI